MIEFEFNNFFGKVITSGITLKSLNNFPNYGFSISAAQTQSLESSLANRKLLSSQLGFESFRFCKQVHGNNIVIDNGNDYTNTEADGILSTFKNTLLIISVADCAGIIFFDNVKGVIGAIHSGWKGTQLQIAKKAVEQMQISFNSSLNEIKAWISPCASVEHYEVGKEFTNIFPHSTIKVNEKYYFNNKLEIKKQLLDSGISNSNILISENCSIENLNYHSYRRDKENSGRMAAFIGFKD